jgi:hypothetical protein
MMLNIVSNIGKPAAWTVRTGSTIYLFAGQLRRDESDNHAHIILYCHVDAVAV